MKISLTFYENSCWEKWYNRFNIKISMEKDIETQNISKIISSNPNSRLEAIFKTQIAPDPDAISESYRRQYDMIPCLEAAIFHLLDPNFHLADATRQSEIIQRFNASTSSVFDQMPNKSVLSIGGIEAAAFLELGAGHATIYDSDFNPLNLHDHTNIEFHASRFEPGSSLDQKFGVVIGSMIFDNGSELVDSFMTFDVNDYVRRYREDNWNIVDMRDYIKATFDVGAEDYRRAHRLSIYDFCKEWKVTARSYWSYIQEKIDLPRDDKGNIIFDKPVSEVLAGYGFEPDDIKFLEEGMITHEMIKIRKYREYARSLWEQVDEGGLMLIDGNRALASVEGLENCNIEATYTLEYNDEYRLVVMRKAVSESDRA